MMRSLFLIVALVGLFFIEFYAAAKFKETKILMMYIWCYDKTGEKKSTSSGSRKRQGRKISICPILEIKSEEKMEIKVVLYLKGRRILWNSEITKIVADEFHCMKGPRARKLVYSLKENFVGLDQNYFQDILNQDKSHYRWNARLKLIWARDVQVRDHNYWSYGYGKRGTDSQWYLLPLQCMCLYRLWMFLVYLCGWEL